MARLQLCLTVLAALACAVVSAEQLVTQLVDSNFTAFINAHDKVILEFYAPWCKHCRSFVKDYERAAKALKEEGIVCARMDGTKNYTAEVTHKHDVTAFPTFKIFRGSPESVESWQAPRNLLSFIHFAGRMFGEPSKALRTAEDVANLAQMDFAVVAVFPPGSEESEDFKEYVDTAGKLREDISFGHVFDKALVPECDGCDTPTLVVYKTWEPRVAQYSGPFKVHALLDFVERAETPELVELDERVQNRKPLEKIFSSGKPKVFGVAPADYPELKAFKENLITIGKKNSEIHVFYVDPAVNDHVYKFFNITADALPALLVHEPQTQVRRVGLNLAPGDMLAWAKKYKAGKIEQVYKSEPVPETQDGLVYKVVGSQLREFVTSQKDIFLTFHIDDCHHCDQMKEEWERLAEFFKDSNITIASFDASKNDIEDVGFELGGYPSIFLIRGHDLLIFEYTGKRNVHEMYAWMKTQLPESSFAGLSPSIPVTEDEQMLRDILAGKNPEVSIRGAEAEAEPVVQDEDEYEDVELTEEEAITDEL